MDFLKKDEYGQLIFNFEKVEQINEECSIRVYDSDPYTLLLMIKKGEVVDRVLGTSFTKFKAEHSRDEIIRKYFS